MLPASAVVKLTARTAMKGKYLKCFICGGILFFAYIVCLYVAQMISFVSNSVIGTVFFCLLSAFAVLPLFLGVLRFFRRLLWGADDNPVEAFHYFSSVKLYKRVMKLVALIVLRLIIAGIPLFIPAIITEVLSNEEIYNLFKMNMPVWSSNLWVLTAFLEAVAGIILILVMLKFYLAPFLLVADEEMEPEEAMHMSAVISKRSAADFFFLIISFAGWILLSLFMVPLIFTMPYFFTSYLVHSRFAVTQYNRVVDNFNSANTPPTYAAEM